MFIIHFWSILRFCLWANQIEETISLLYSLSFICRDQQHTLWSMQYTIYTQKQFILWPKQSNFHLFEIINIKNVWNILNERKSRYHHNHLLYKAMLRISYATHTPNSNITNFYLQRLFGYEFGSNEKLKKKIAHKSKVKT